MHNDHIIVTSMHSSRQVIEPISNLGITKSPPCFFRRLVQRSQTDVKCYNPDEARTATVSTIFTPWGRIRRDRTPRAHCGGVTQCQRAELPRLSDLWELSRTCSPTRSHLVHTTVVDDCSADATNAAYRTTFPTHIIIAPHARSPRQSPTDLDWKPRITCAASNICEQSCVVSSAAIRAPKSQFVRTMPNGRLSLPDAHL
jgi:hypothetical protein